GTASTQLTIKEAPATPAEPENPAEPANPTQPTNPADSSGSLNTGDSAPTGLWITVMLVSLAAMVALVLIARKKKGKQER
ncbi:MAG: hypothetical protein HUJ69_07030, partial [Lachnospiraceae bacterium]|nr:hypothetical protein [Lachnospiraceae bacterium]